jgi:hypothetical protein
MAITGVHALLYSPEADALRALLRDVLQWPSVDGGQGWPIFALPPAELGVHPADKASHELSLMCDDIEATVADLKAKGIVVKEDAPVDHGWGIAVTMVLPGDVDVMLYQPRHASPL